LRCLNYEFDLFLVSLIGVYVLFYLSFYTIENYNPRSEFRKLLSLGERCDGRHFAKFDAR
jgi:hypothetical protein